jgi:16S rRNA (cytidine1402-2'-O)-methyltransferase
VSLVVVGTPIGNLGDLAPRAVEALRDADVVACEDTRRTGRLLEAAGIGRRPLVVVNDHTERRAARDLVQRMRAGETVALVTDAGMPAVSDPGAELVALAVRAGVDVSVVPGPTAATAALAVSGLPSGRWVFEGFLPRKGADRAERIDALVAETRTAVLYEAPHRIRRTVDDLLAACGPDRQVALARELTKLHEEVVRGSLAQVAGWLEAHEPRGEFVVVLGGGDPPPAASDDDLRAALAAAHAAGASTRDAVAEVAREHGVPKRRVYDLATRSAAAEPERTARD